MLTSKQCLLDLSHQIIAEPIPSLLGYSIHLVNWYGPEIANEIRAVRRGLTVEQVAEMNFFIACFVIEELTTTIHT